jgi:hypothetical protein
VQVGIGREAVDSPVYEPGDGRDERPAFDSQGPILRGIEDVDLGEEAGGDEAEDDAFLVEEEEEGDNMSGLLDTGGGKEEDEES